jgi:hypothetical protein
LSYTGEEICIEWDSIVMGEVLYSILIEFNIPTKLVRLIRMCLNETCGKVCICKLLSDAFPVQNGFKHGDAFQLFFRISLLEGPIKTASDWK